jgi:hypothetical protein
VARAVLFKDGPPVLHHEVIVGVIDQDYPAGGFLAVQGYGHHVGLRGARRARGRVSGRRALICLFYQVRGDAVAQPVETKVQASTAAAAVSGLALWTLGHYVFKGTVPDVVASWVYVLVPAVVTFGAGYLAKHTPRPAAADTGRQVIGAIKAYENAAGAVPPEKTLMPPAAAATEQPPAAAGPPS